MLGYYLVVAAATTALLVWSAGQPHSAVETEEESGTTPPAAAVAPGQLTAHFPPAEVAKFRTIVQSTLDKVRAGDQNGAKARITDLETAWDQDESTLRPMDQTDWRVIDKQIDAALSALRSSHPDPAVEVQKLNDLLSSLR
jgi:hypothetical protein